MVTWHLEVESSVMISHNFWNTVQFFPCVELVSKLYATYTFSWLQSLLKMTRSSQAVTKKICAVQLGCVKANDPPVLHFVLHVHQEIPIMWYRLSHSLRWWPEVISRLPLSAYQLGEIVSWQTFACTVRSSGESMSIALQTCGPLLVVKLNPWLNNNK